MVTEVPEIRAYWNYDIYPNSPAGIWTVEIRLDGQPAGSHSFELIVPPPPVAPTAPTLDDVYRNSLRSMVWIHKLDPQGRRVDISSGFVIAQDRVLTAFQAIDAADGIDVEFADGRTVKAEALAGWNRLQDWAILSLPTLAVPAIAVDKSEIAIGEHYVVFSVETGLARTFGGIDVSGRRQDAVCGDRILLSPILGAETAGGPLLTLSGKVVGLLGGSVVPGSRFEERSSPRSSPYWAQTSIPGGAIPIALAKETGSATLTGLRAAGVLSHAIRPNGNFLSAMTMLTPKKGRETAFISRDQFSRQDSISVWTSWLKKEKEGKGVFSAKIFDAQNRLLVDIAPRKVSLNANSEARLQFDFLLDKAPKGTYRIDVRWNEDTVWRSFVSLVD